MVWIAIIVGVILLIIFPKQILAILGVLVLAVAAIFFYSQEQENKRQREKDRVQVSVKYDKKNCSEEYPLLIVIRNTGYKPVNKVSWNIAAYRPGYSSNVVSYGTYSSSWNAPYSTDKILKKDETNWLCYKVPTIQGKLDPATLKYEITNKSVVFQK